MWWTFHWKVQINTICWRTHKWASWVFNLLSNVSIIDIDTVFLKYRNQTNSHWHFGHSHSNAIVGLRQMAKMAYQLKIFIFYFLWKNVLDQIPMGRDETFHRVVVNDLKWGLMFLLLESRSFQVSGKLNFVNFFIQNFVFSWLRKW